MKKSKFTEGQIIKIINEADAVEPVPGEQEQVRSGSWGIVTWAGIHGRDQHEVLAIGPRLHSRL